MRWAMMARILVMGTRSPVSGGGGACGAAGLAAVASCRALLAEVAEDVVFGDAAAGAGAGDLREVEVVFFGDAAHERRGAEGRPSCDRRARGWLRAAGLELRGRAVRGWLCAGAARRLSGCAADDGDDGVDFDRCAFGNLDLGEHAGYGRRNLRIDFVGGDFKERLVFLDVSPTFLSHLVMVPSKMDSPICGMTMSIPWEAAGWAMRLGAAAG